MAKIDAKYVNMVMAALASLTEATGQIVEPKDGAPYGQLTLTTETGDTMELSLEQFNLAYNGMVRCWPAIKPLKEEVIAKQRDAAGAEKLAKKAAKEAEKAERQAKVKADREAKLKAKEEAKAAKEKAKEEAKAKKEAEAKAKAEEKAKADKEKLRLAAEAKAKADKIKAAGGDGAAPTPKGKMEKNNAKPPITKK